MKLKLGIAVLATMLIQVFTGCGSDDQTNSNIDALSSNDWFKSGVDRFYLAYADRSYQIMEDHPETHGERFFFGIGCYGESENPYDLTKVNLSPNSKDTKLISLNERTMLHQFDIVENGQNPEPGQCKILIGDEITPQKISNSKDLYKNGNTAKVTEKIIGASLGCFSLVATAIKFGGTVVAGGYATAQTGGAAAPIAIPLIVTETAGLVTSGFYCVLKTKETGEEVHKFKVTENQQLFANSMKRASDLTIEQLKQDEQFDRFINLAYSGNPQKVQVASAIWNKTLVKIFNTEVHDKFENGWGQGTKFFDAVSEIKTEPLSGAKSF